MDLFIKTTANPNVCIYNQTDKINVTIELIGGNNIANAIYNGASINNGTHEQNIYLIM
ncbi:MAG: hypothetical protein MJ209_01350 [archaeon]|nr:hypothetical protein [archaeon]